MESRPNILVIMADQFRAMALGASGTDPVLTPNLDRLAEEGVLVDHAVSNYPVCSPHRAMFLTSALPTNNGVTHNINSVTAEQGVGLRDGIPTWATVLRDRGYRTGYIGKWHLEPPTDDDETHGEGRREDGKVWDAYSPTSRRFGFDFWHAYGAADSHLSPHYWVGDAAREERLDVDAWSAEHEIDVAIDVVRESPKHDAPFALMVSLNPPHQPFDAVPDRYRHAYDHLSAAELLPRDNVAHGTPVATEAADIARDYFSAATGVDDQIGRLLDALDAQELAENTVVIFTSDHGMQLGSHGMLFKNVPYEESMRIPCVVRQPGRIPPGRSTEMVTSLDFAPTILGLAGEADAVPATMHGRDRSAALRGLEDVSADPAASYHRFPSATEPESIRGIRTRDAKLIASLRPNGTVEIRAFDLHEDPFELASDTRCEWVPALAERLLTRMVDEGDTWGGADQLKRLFA
ncbi:sulfatase [Microbacterium sp. MPKO10]|uniref:sulfatase family protein n=1 Tax=Microbacterium sp. MPKO10 TaxID=2989818 RepID=UPI00223605D5|nr:sulfatase [Microbacterium sp. MPKO10]MCW4460027.1 sulfatase [Microbacterium sp. MPKO10]